MVLLALDNMHDEFRDIGNQRYLTCRWYHRGARWGGACSIVENRYFNMKFGCQAGGLRNFRSHTKSRSGDMDQLGIEKSSNRKNGDTEIPFALKDLSSMVRSPTAQKMSETNHRSWVLPRRHKSYSSSQQDYLSEFSSFMAMRSGSNNMETASTPPSKANSVRRVASSPDLEFYNSQNLDTPPVMTCGSGVTNSNSSSKQKDLVAETARRERAPLSGRAFGVGAQQFYFNSRETDRSVPRTPEENGVAGNTHHRHVPPNTIGPLTASVDLFSSFPVDTPPRRMQKKYNLTMRSNATASRIQPLAFDDVLMRNDSDRNPELMEFTPFNDCKLEGRDDRLLGNADANTCRTPSFSSVPMNGVTAIASPPPVPPRILDPDLLLSDCGEIGKLPILELLTPNSC